MEELERLRADLLGMVSDELRTPLSSIKGSAATLLGDSHDLDPAEMRQFFRLIDQQADRIRDLVANLADVARIHTGALTVSLGAGGGLRPGGAGRKVVAERGGGRARPRGRSPRRTCPGLRRTGVGWSRCLVNLLSNATGYFPESSPIRVSARWDGDLVAISVAGQGSRVWPAMTCPTSSPGLSRDR